jgi:hypothetical protein
LRSRQKKETTMCDPSGDEERAPLSRARAQSSTNYHAVRAAMQALREHEQRKRHEDKLLFFKWKAHGAWLLEGFWQSGDARALDAFVAQLIAWRKRIVVQKQKLTGVNFSTVQASKPRGETLCD